MTIALAPSQNRRWPSGGGVLVSATPARTTVERDHAAATAILDQPHARAGQIAANVRDRAGQLHRSQVLRWCDNPDGRYQITISHPHSNNRSLTVTPCDPQLLENAVQQLFYPLR